MDGIAEMIAAIAQKRNVTINTQTLRKRTEGRSIRGTYQLTETELERSREKILDVEAQQDICRGCNGKECRQTARGMIPVIEVSNGMAYEGVRICRHEQHRRQQERIDRLMKSAKVPAAYSRDTFSDYTVTADNAAAVKAAHWLIGDDSRGLFIEGPRGTGKTKLAAIIANEKAKAGKPVLFSSVPDLLSDIRATFDGGRTAAILQTVREAPCLVLDDLGAERMTEWVSEQLFSIINYRYNERLQTIVTTNYTSRELMERMSIRGKDGDMDDLPGQRIMSRIYGMCERVGLYGDDYRTRGMAV